MLLLKMSATGQPIFLAPVQSLLHSSAPLCWRSTPAHDTSIAYAMRGMPCLIRGKALALLLKGSAIVQPPSCHLALPQLRFEPPVFASHSCMVQNSAHVGNARPLSGSITIETASSLPSKSSLLSHVRDQI